MLIDLHIHTSASDGDQHPQKVLELAVTAGIKVLAFADHETTAGYTLVRGLAADKGVQILPAVELQTWCDDREVHVLGYLMDVDDSQFQSELARLRELRNQCAYEMVEKIRSFGYQIDWDRVKALAELGGPVSKGHIMRTLQKEGYIKSREDAIRILGLYLNQEGKAYSCHKYATKTAIDFIRRYNGIPVLAHPGLINNDQIVKKIVSMGISGLEVYYNYFGPNRELFTTTYQELAIEKGLLMTGGSDYHGTITPVLLGELQMPEKVVAELVKYKTALENEKNI